MNKTGKILLGVGLPLAVLGVYWFGVRNRKPFFMLSKYDFVNKKTKESLINIGSGHEMSILEYAKFILKKIN